MHYTTVWSAKHKKSLHVLEQGRKRGKGRDRATVQVPSTCLAVLEVGQWSSMVFFKPLK